MLTARARARHAHTQCSRISLRHQDTGADGRSLRLKHQGEHRCFLVEHGWRRLRTRGASSVTCLLWSGMHDSGFTDPLERWEDRRPLRTHREGVPAE
eukprot:scaffold43651_cov60-Phaeocystis_antarctica.AAC.1